MADGTYQEVFARGTELLSLGPGRPAIVKLLALRCLAPQGQDRHAALDLNLGISQSFL